MVISFSSVLLTIMIMLWIGVFAATPDELLKNIGENLSDFAYFKSLVVDYVKDGRGGDAKKVRMIVDVAIKRIVFLQRSPYTLETAKEMLAYTILLKGKEDMRFNSLGKKIGEKLGLLPLKRDSRLTFLIDSVITENLTSFLAHLRPNLPLTRGQIEEIYGLMMPQIDNVVIDIEKNIRHGEYKKSMEEAEALEPAFLFSSSLKKKIEIIMDTNEVWNYAVMNDIDIKKFLLLYNVTIVKNRMKYLLSSLQESLSRYDYNSVFRISTFGKRICEFEGLKEEMSDIYKKFIEYGSLYSLAKEIVSLTVKIRKIQEATPLKQVFPSIVDIGERIEETPLASRLNENLKSVITVYKNVISTMNIDEQQEIRAFVKDKLSERVITNDVVKTGVKDILSVSTPSPTEVIRHPGQTTRASNSLMMILLTLLIFFSLLLILWSAIPTYRWAGFFGKIGFYSFSVYLYHKLLSRNPASVDIHLGLAEVLERAGKRTEAQKEYNLALKLISLKDRYEKK